MFPCSCSSLQNHDNDNQFCVSNLLPIHLNNIENLKKDLQEKLREKQKKYAKQMKRNPIPKSSTATKNQIDKINDFLSKQTPTPFVLRPKFKNKICIGFHHQPGPGQVQQMKNKIRETIGRDNWQFTDGRATGENHVLHLRQRFGLQVSDEQIAAQFGRHTVEVMKSNYINQKKETNALEAYNLIRETYDAMPFDENAEIDPFISQRKNLQKLKNSNIMIKDKRKSLEILSQVISHPPPHPLHQYQQQPSPLESINQNIQHNSTIEKSSNNKENEEGILTQNFNALKNHSQQSLSQDKISNFNLMGLLFKQQIHYQKEEDEAWERRQKRREENNRAFQKMMLNEFK